jgi:5-methylcytosine-specific restriction endonuclease McrA
VPTRALKSCERPGCGGLTAARFCERCIQEGHGPSRTPFGSRSGSEARLTTTQRGLGAAWRKLRKWILSIEPLCRPCKQEGRFIAATQVDHIIPRADGGTDEYPENLQPICDDCHRMKTAREDSRPAALIPSWLKPSLIPLTIVCGPPAAGKSTLVKERMAAHDLVIDLDDIIETLSLRHRYHWGRSNWITKALRYRNNLLGALSKKRYTNAAWLIVGAPLATERSRWSQLLVPQDVVVVETAATVCIDRIRRDESRTGVAQSQINAVWSWWNHYSPTVGDKGIKITGVDASDGLR